MFGKPGGSVILGNPLGSVILGIVTFGNVMLGKPGGMVKLGKIGIVKFRRDEMLEYPGIKRSRISAGNDCAPPVKAPKSFLIASNVVNKERSISVKPANDALYPLIKLFQSAFSVAFGQAAESVDKIRFMKFSNPRFLTTRSNSCKCQ